MRMGHELSRLYILTKKNAQFGYGIWGARNKSVFISNSLRYIK